MHTFRLFLLSRRNTDRHNQGHHILRRPCRLAYWWKRKRAIQRLESGGNEVTGKVTHDDLKLLQGTWTITSLEVDGQAMPDYMLDNSRIQVRGDRFTTTGMGASYKG